MGQSIGEREAAPAKDSGATSVSRLKRGSLCSESRARHGSHVTRRDGLAFGRLGTVISWIALATRKPHHWLHQWLHLARETRKRPASVSRNTASHLLFVWWAIVDTLRTTCTP